MLFSFVLVLFFLCVFVCAPVECLVACFFFTFGCLMSWSAIWEFNDVLLCFVCASVNERSDLFTVWWLEFCLGLMCLTSLGACFV